MSNRAAKGDVTTLLLDESGEGNAEYTVALGFFAVQCICGAIALNHQIGDVIHTIWAVLG